MKSAYKSISNAKSDLIFKTWVCTNVLFEILLQSTLNCLLWYKGEIFCLSGVYTCSPYQDLNLSNIEKISIIRGQSLNNIFPNLLYLESLKNWAVNNLLMEQVSDFDCFLLAVLFLITK